MYGQRSSTYLDYEALDVSRRRLIPLLYEGMLENLRRADEQIGTQDVEGKSRSLRKASEIVYELLASLDFEAGGDLAPRLAGLYGYFVTEIAEVGRTLDRQRLASLVTMVSALHGAWDDTR